MSFDIKNLDIKINCHSSICINHKVYIDPFEITASRHDASHIFITHSHYDHFDLKSVLNLINLRTIIVCTKDVFARIKDYSLGNEIVVVTNNSEGDVGGIHYKTFPSYNSHHPRVNGYVGYTLTIDDVTYTILGDTDANEDLEDIVTDVLLVPIGGTYTMDAMHAASLTNILKPKLAIPTHYNYLEGTGSKDDEAVFLKYIDSKIKTQILI